MLGLRRRLILAVVAISAVGALLMLPTDEILIRPLETRFPADSLAPARPIDGIIALGGDDARINAAAELARLYPAARLMVTGENPEKRLATLFWAMALPQQRLRWGPMPRIRLRMRLSPRRF